MSERGRLQEIFTALVHRRIAESLERVENALGAWRRGEKTVLATHAEVLRHAARANVLSNRVARAGLEGPDTLLRDALDAGVIAAEEFTALTGKRPEDIAVSPTLDEEAARTGGPEMPAKRTVMDKLLQDGPVLVHLDPRRDGVQVPTGHRVEPRLVLRFGNGLSPPILDLSIDDLSLAGTLTFRGVPHHCVIPWQAIFALVGEDGRGLVWSEDVPAEIAHEYTRDPKVGTATGDKGEKRPDKPDPEPEPTKPKRGHLKLV